MSMHDEDRSLRERFSALRREEERGAPPLQRVLAAARAHQRPRGARLAAATGGIVALAALAVAILTSLYPRAPVEPPLTLAAWTEPTAFLLRTPGAELLSTVPRFAPGIPVAESTQEESR